MGLARMDIKEVYSNVLLISIANKRNFYHLVKEAEEETKEYINTHNQESTGIYEVLPEGFAGLFFIESLARKVGSSLGEAYFLTEDRKEDIILDFLKSIDPINEAFSDYYDDSIEGQVEFSGLARVLDLSDLNHIQQVFRAKEIDGKNVTDDLKIPYSVIFQRIADRTDVSYTLFLSAVDSFASSYFSDDYIIWTGKNGPIADYINEVIKAHSDLAGKDPETRITDSEQEIYSLIPYKNTISNDQRQLTERAYIKIGGEKTTSRYLPILINRKTNALYIPLQLFTEHNDELKKGTVMLCKSFSGEGKTIRLAHTQERIEGERKESNKSQNDNRWEDNFSVVLFKGAFSNPEGKEKRYAMIKTLNNAERFLLVYVDLNERRIYFNENEVVENYKYFNWNVIELYYSFNSRDRKVNINPLPSKIKEVLEKSSKERELLSVRNLPASKMLQQNTQQNTKFKAKSNKQKIKPIIKKGPLCPVCRKPYSGELFEDSFNAPGAKMCYNCFRKFRISMRDD